VQQEGGGGSIPRVGDGCGERRQGGGAEADAVERLAGEGGAHRHGSQRGRCGADGGVIRGTNVQQLHGVMHILSYLPPLLLLSWSRTSVSGQKEEKALLFRRQGIVLKGGGTLCLGSADNHTYFV